MNQEQLLKVPEAAKQLGVTEDTVRRWLREGKLIGTLIGGDTGGYRIPESEVGRMLAGLPVPGSRIVLTLAHAGRVQEIDPALIISKSRAPKGGTIIVLQSAHRTGIVFKVAETINEIDALICKALA